MSEANQTRTLPGPRIQEIARVALPKILEDERGVNIPLPLPEGYPELWMIVSRHRLLLAFSLGLRVRLPQHDVYCQRCRKVIEKMRAPETPEGFAYLLQQVNDTIQQCNCISLGVPPMTAAAAGEQGQQSLRINPTGNRVKVISTGEPAAPPPAAQETIRLTKSRGVTVLEDGKVAGAGTAEEETAERFTAPSIRFQPSSSTQVEVTIPHYVCEALVRHCGESNLHKREVGGVLVGHQEETHDDGSGRRTYSNVVTDLIPFKPSDSSGSHLHLDADSWVHISNIYEEKYQPWKKVRLGWYHTHPTQGIFFSPPDHDFHTNFNQPFQFAIVVDPRNMKAGLVYWKNYEARYTEGPINFSLKRRNETRNSGGGAPPSQTAPDVESPPAAWVRIFFFVLVTLAVLGYVVTHSPPFSVSPPHACLLALNLLVGLRLLNADFFRPAERPEDKAFTVLRGWWWIALDRLELSLERRPNLAYVGLLIATVLTALLLLRALWQSQRADAPARNRVGLEAKLIGEGTPAALARQNDGRQDGRRRLNLGHNGGRLSLSSDGWPRVMFRKASNGQWEPLDVAAEMRFLRNVLKLDANVGRASDDVRLLQRQLKANAVADIEDDGIWGAKIRNALLNELMQAQTRNREWFLHSGDGEPRFVVVGSDLGPEAERLRERPSRRAAAAPPRRSRLAQRRR